MVYITTRLTNWHLVICIDYLKYLLFSYVLYPTYSVYHIKYHYNICFVCSVGITASNLMILFQICSLHFLNHRSTTLITFVIDLHYIGLWYQKCSIYCSLLLLYCKCF